MFRGDADADYIYSIAVIRDEKNRLFVFVPVLKFHTIPTVCAKLSSFLKRDADRHIYHNAFLMSSNATVLTVFIHIY